MSTKTTFKRVALVAVAALGLGVLTSVAPANATANKAVSSLTAGTMPAVRPGVVANLPVTAVFAASAATTDTITVTAKVISAPTGSVLYQTSSTANSAGALLNITEDSTAFGDGTASFTYFTNSSGLTDAQVTENLVVSGTVGTTTGAFRVSLNADLAGTYQILVSGNAATWTAGNPSTILTVTTTGAPASMSISSLGKVVEGAASGYGANLAITLKDAAGATTILGANEAINVTTSNSTATSLSVSTLASPSSSGTYTVIVEDGTIAADGTAVITFTGSGTLPATLTLNTTVSIVNTGELTEQVTLTSATGYVGSSTPYYTSAKSAHGFTLAKAISADTSYAINVNAEGTGARDYATNATVTAALDTVDFTVTQAFSSTGVTSVAVGTSSAGSAVSTPIVINRESAVANDIAVVGQSAILLATGGSAALTVGIIDQFGNAVKDSAVTVGVAGRNTVSTTALGVTDALGYISYTLKDAGTTGTTDTVTFTCSSCANSSSGNTAITSVAFTVTYGTVTVAKVSFTGPNTTAGVASATTTVSPIRANQTPEASTAAASVVVTDAAGNLLAGVPVVFTVSGTTAAITSNVATVYTSSAGKADSTVFAWVAGTYTVTATAGGVTGTGSYTFANSTAADARVLSATATDGIISAKVVDRFGNPVSGVSVYASRTSGTGYFGTGVSKTTTTTGTDGIAEFTLIGNAEVKVSTLSYDAVAGTNAPGQTCALAGNFDCAVGATAAVAFTATTAGTTTAAAKNYGSTFAPAGVSTVSVTVSNSAAADAATAAADAAAEATDAANAATDAANAAAEAADAATAAAQDAADAVAALSTQVSEMVDALKKQITALTNLVIKIQKKVKA